MKTTKVLNIYRTYFPDPPGGLQEAIRQICITTSDNGIDNSIFTLSPNPCPSLIRMAEAKVYRERSWIAPASCDIGGYSAVSRYLKLHQENDVIHYYHPWPFADLLNGLRRTDKPAVLTYVSDIVRQKFWGALHKPLLWRTLKSMRFIVANSQSYVDTSSILSDPEIREKVRVIPLGIDERSYSWVADESILTRLGLESKEPYFLFLGVLRYYKGIHTLIDAAKKINCKIIIAGSGPMEKSLRQQVADLNLKNITFAGQVSNQEKVALLQNCIALVLPSHLRSEAYGMVLVEASMMRKPMISCEIGTGTSYVNLNEETGLVVPPEAPLLLADAMTQFIANEACVLRMGQAARSRYDSFFSGVALGKAYSSLYQECFD